MKQFSTAARRAQREEQDQSGLEPIHFEFDEQELVANPPGDGQFAMLMASMVDYATNTQTVAAAINFVFSLLDDDSRRYVQRRLMNPKDVFGGEDIMDMVQFFVEEWTANPTREPSGSTSSPPTDGPKSTVKRRHGVKTPSASDPTASAP